MKKLPILLFSILLLWSPMNFADESDKELIEEMKTFYVGSCKIDLVDAFGGNEEEYFTAICECLFDFIMDAGFTEEELFGTDGMYEIYQAKAKGTYEGWTAIDEKIVDIQMDSMGKCL